MLSGDLEPRDVVADLDRKRELGLGLAFLRLEGEGGVAERQDLDGERAGRVVGAGERARARNAALDHGDRPLLDDPSQRRDEFAAAAEIDAVAEPDQLDVGRGTQKAAERREYVQAFHR